jgi:hypothetical protein
VTEALAAMCKTLAPTYKMHHERAKHALGPVNISDGGGGSMIYKAA